MASTQSDIITSITETRHESDVNSKQKLMVPRRIIEEEVWFSGSELKTDNSSSEDENAERSTGIQDRIKKGAKKKTKTVTQSARSRKNILREQHLEEMITETTIKTIQEVTTSTTTSTSTSSDTNENGLIPSSHEKSTYDALEKLLSKCEDNSHSFMQMSCNRADDEKSQLQKIRQLEERIAKAEKVYLEARSETNQLVVQMENMLNSVAGLKGPDWDFFNDITKKWIRCFSGSNCKTGFFENSSHTCRNEDDQKFEENELKKSQHISLKNKDKNRKFIRIRKGTHCSIVLRNIKQCSKRRFVKDMKVPPLNEYEQSRLNTLLSSEENVYHANEKYMGYTLQSNELEKLSNISTQLVACRLRNSKHSLNISDEDLEAEETYQDIQIDDYIQNASLTDSQKQRLVNASHSNLSLSDSVDEYGSCDEPLSAFASSTNIQI